MRNQRQKKPAPLPHGKEACDAVQIDLVEAIARKPKTRKRRTNDIR